MLPIMEGAGDAPPDAIVALEMEKLDVYIRIDT